ncbi:hypothetical protein CN918_28815 [Priestia megaterium]|nr:hypothetical protein CN918_28815 [Priestia megaterium]
MTHRYITTLDGMKHIETLNPLNSGDYIYIKDDLYTDEPTLFKVKQVTNSNIDLKLVKVADVYDTSQEQPFTSGVSYFFNNSIVVSEIRLSKNQIIRVSGRYYSVTDIKKDADTNTLSLSFLAYTQADNLYTVFKTHRTTKKREAVETYYEYGKALGKVYSLREKEDDFYYHFG